MEKIIILIIVLVSLTSCFDKDQNGKLDGIWQLMEVEKVDEPTIYTKEKGIYYSVQLELFSLRNLSNEYLGRFNHSGDSLFLYEFREAITGDTSHLATEVELNNYYISDIAERFEIEGLTKSKMVLKSKYSRLRLRKY